VPIKRKSSIGTTSEIQGNGRGIRWRTNQDIFRKPPKRRGNDHKQTYSIWNFLLNSEAALLYAFLGCSRHRQTFFSFFPLPFRPASAERPRADGPCSQGKEAAFYGEPPLQ
jgi:hypothetical protein